MSQSKKIQIPSYLKNSELVQALDPDDVIEIPLEYYKKDDIINDNHDLLLYLKTIDYFCLDEQYISQSIYEYIFQNRSIIVRDCKLMLYIDKNVEFKHLAKLGPDEIDEQIKLHVCIKNNYFNCFKILLNSFYPWDEDTCILIINQNKINFLIYLYEFYVKYKIWIHFHKEFPWSYRIIKTAIKNGNLEILKYAFDNNCILTNYPLCNLAIICKQYHLLDYLQECDFKWDCSKLITEGQKNTNSRKYHDSIYKNIIMQIIINSVIHGREDYGLPPLTLNEINNRIITNKKIDETIQEIISQLWEFDGAESLTNPPIEWIQESLYNTTEEIINP
jgi:hypothetical protein